MDDMSDKDSLLALRRKLAEQQQHLERITDPSENDENRERPGQVKEAEDELGA
jgi:hypothetical protein